MVKKLPQSHFLDFNGMLFSDFVLFSHSCIGLYALDTNDESIIIENVFASPLQLPTNFDHVTHLTIRIPYCMLSEYCENISRHPVALVYIFIFMYSMYDSGWVQLLQNIFLYFILGGG